MIGSRTGKTQRMIEDLLVARDQAAASGKPFRAVVIVASDRCACDIRDRLHESGGPSPDDDSTIDVVALRDVGQTWGRCARVFVDTIEPDDAVADLIERCT